MSTNITRTEKSCESGNDIVMSFFMEQNDSFFIWTRGRTESLAVKRAIGIDKDETVVEERGCVTELCEFLMTTRTLRDVGLVVEKHCKFFLYFSPSSNGLPFSVVVESGFGSNNGSCTT